MIESIWWAIKPGEPRRHVFSCAPTKESAAMLTRDGYEIVRVEFEWPDMASAAVEARVIRATMPTLSEADERAALQDRCRALEDELMRERARGTT